MERGNEIIFSFILVDVIELRLAEGMPLEDAVVDASAVRFRLMMLTIAAVVIGTSVILFDQNFKALPYHSWWENSGPVFFKNDGSYPLFFT